MKTYGHPTPAGHFVIQNPRTPEAWLHYLIRVGQPGTQTFCSGVSSCGGGFDLRGTHENTIVDTRLHLNDRDDMGRYLYLFDEETRELWSAQWQPCERTGQEFRTTLRFGAMEFVSRFQDIESRIVMTVPREFDGWVQDVVISNRGKTRRHLSLYPFVPIHMGDALVRLLAGDNDSFFGGAHFDRELRGIIFHRNHGIPVSDQPDQISGMLGNVALFYSSLNREHTPYETDLETFFGSRFNDQRNPQGLLSGKLSSRDTAYLRRACGVFQHRITLEPGEQCTFGLSLMLGSTAEYYRGKKQDLRDQCALVDSNESRKNMTAAVEDWWMTQMSSLTLACPHDEISRGFPWLQYQCHIVHTLNRMKSRYHTGYEYGWGFRDILQDILFYLAYDPASVHHALLHIATQMFSDGSCYHNFFLNQRGNRSVQACDDPLWFPNAVCAYCRETGEFSLLDVTVPYADAQEGQEDRQGTILEHCIAALSRVWTDSSSRHLPYLKDCDWNDDLNLERINGEPNTTMESVMAAQQHHQILLEMANLLHTSHREPELAAEYGKRAELIRNSLNTYARDSQGYYKRALSLDSRFPDLGSSESREGKIFLEPQVFSVLSGVADEKQAVQALEAVQENLDTPYGAMLLWPVFTGLAEQSTLPTRSWNIEKEPPAMKENGGIFMHLNAWLIQAYCKLGMGRQAVSHYRKILPESLAADQDRYMAEPYVYPEYVRGTATAQFGRGGHTWLTGTAPTMHQTLTEYIFGIRAEFQGLRIDPCIDPRWPECSITRRFRGSTYHIQIKNPSGVSRGVKSLTLDGQGVVGNLIPQGPAPIQDQRASHNPGNPHRESQNQGNTHHITVVLG